MNKLEKQICAFLSKPNYRPVNAERLAGKLDIREKQARRFESALESLLHQNVVAEARNGKLTLNNSQGMVAGIVRRTSSGAGFVIPHGATPGDRLGDVYVSKADIHDAQTGDDVLVRLLSRRGSGGRRSGRIEQVVARATRTFVGTYLEDGGEGYVQIDGKNFNQLISVGDPGAKGAQPNDKVVIEMLRFPTHAQLGEAVLTEVLGASDKAGVDTQSIICQFGLPTGFPEQVLDDAKQQAEQFDENNLQGRTDLTGETIVTIDPKDARDFDDAISLKRTDDGHWHLGVHIADVAHFVRPGSALDREAHKRGTSVYLPGRVIPMLPEVISNGLASLQKGKVRFTKSVFIEFTADGIPVDVEFGNTAIKVTRRFAYEEVMPSIRDPERQRIRVSVKVRQLLERMHELAMILRKRRFERGTLELHLPEVKLLLDSSGRVIGAKESEHDESHQIIEEFMLAANTAVATELSDRDIPCLRRVHGAPDYKKLRDFSLFTAALGFPLKQFQSRPELQALLKRVHGEPSEQAINFALLRSLKQAEYSPDDNGHYALAIENYCHFTSPIRRYPDLTVHRLINALLTAKGGRKRSAPEQIIRLGKHCSETERRAAAAERELTNVKLLTYMNERVDDEFDAVVTGVEKFGVFCRLAEVPVEGMIHISALDANDYFDHEPALFSLVGRRSGLCYRLGDRIRVRVAMVDVDRRELELRIVKHLGSESQPGRGKSKKKKSRAQSDGKANVDSGRKRGARSGRKKSGAKSPGQGGAGSGRRAKSATKGTARAKGAKESTAAKGTARAKGAKESTAAKGTARAKGTKGSTAAKGANGSKVSKGAAGSRRKKTSVRRKKRR